VIRSAASLSYPEAQRLLREGSGERAASLRTLDRLAKALRARRLEHGGLELDLPEIKPELDASGEPIAFDEAPRLPTHELIEEFMLLANQIVGRRARALELPFLYRVHERPRYDKLRAFFEAARYLGRQGPAQIVTDAKQLRRWISHGKSAKDRLLNLYLLRALEKARYDLVDVGHFGLGWRYAHFTSLIRRYLDLANHRIVKRYRSRTRGRAAILEVCGGMADVWWRRARPTRKSRRMTRSGRPRSGRRGFSRGSDSRRSPRDSALRRAECCLIEGWRIEGFSLRSIGIRR
jgi:ribonuclease R